MKWILAGMVLIAGIIAVGAVAMAVVDDVDEGATADFAGQGGDGPMLAVDGARLVRSEDGLRVSATVPTPVAGSYEYPSGDMVPGWSTAHPDVQVGGPGEPEVFTMWAVVFNYPDECTDASCGADDFHPDAAAKGGVYQADGRVAKGDVMELVGSVRIGQLPFTGSPLENTLGAEVHLAIAPHGKALPAPDNWRQLNGPLGNPTLWWAATFAP
jgi:hypothetical protein